MKTIVVETKKVVAQQENGELVIDTVKQKLSPEPTFLKFVKYLPSQGYKSVEVLKVLKGEQGQTELKEVDKYQAMVDEALKPADNTPVDYKALSEKQSSIIDNLAKRLEALESKSAKTDKSEYRLSLEAKAKELNISLRGKITDEKLLEKIKELDPSFDV